MNNYYLSTLDVVNVDLWPAMIYVCMYDNGIAHDIVTYNNALCIYELALFVLRVWNFQNVKTSAKSITVQAHAPRGFLPTTYII